jgi:hypothetical protein
MASQSAAEKVPLLGTGSQNNSDVDLDSLHYFANGLQAGRLQNYRRRIYLCLCFGCSSHDVGSTEGPYEEIREWLT